MGLLALALVAPGIEHGSEMDRRAPSRREAYTVLVVEPDQEARRRLSSWLGEAGFNVTECPGPITPEYTCPAGRCEFCALAAAADVIVLDLWLESDTMMTGTPGCEVLFYYLSLNKPVVVLGHEEDPLRPLPQEGIAVLRRPPDRASLIAAVRALLPVRM